MQTIYRSSAVTGYNTRMCRMQIRCIASAIPTNAYAKADRILINSILSARPNAREAIRFVDKITQAPATSILNNQGLVPSLRDTSASIILSIIRMKDCDTSMKEMGSVLGHAARLGQYPLVFLDVDQRLSRSKRNAHMSALCEAIDKTMLDAHFPFRGARLLDYGVFEVVRPSGLGDAEVVVNLSIIRHVLQSGYIPIVVPRSYHVHKGKYEDLKVQTAVMSTLQGWAESYSTLPTKVLLFPNGKLPKSIFCGYPLVNLEQDYHIIKNRITNHWETHGDEAVETFDLIVSILNFLPVTASALVMNKPVFSRLVGNLITNKPPVSPSLVKPSEGSTFVGPVVVRRGIQSSLCSHFGQVNKPKLATLLENSFGRILDTSAYYQRLQQEMAGILIAGNYEGASVMTMEGPYVYLDKFAVARSSQGLGAADLLWNEMLVHWPDFFWRSRQSNPVNSWYFDRCTGHIKVGGTDWTLFWHMQHHPSTEMIEELIKRTKSIPASFVKT